MGRRGKPPTFSVSERRGIQSIDVGADILRIVASFPGPATLKEISVAADMAPSKIHRYLSSFARAGLIEQDGSSGRYDLGPTALQIGLTAISRLNVVDAAARHMETLTQATGFTSLLCIWGALGPTIVRWRRGSENIVTSLALGSVLPVTRSATGLVFATYLPEDVVKEKIASELRENRRLELTSPLTKQDVATMTARVREQGFATVSETTIPGLKAAAVPVLDPQGEAAAVITLITASSTFTNAKNPTLQSLIDTGRSASIQKG